MLWCLIPDCVLASRANLRSLFLSTSGVRLVDGDKVFRAKMDPSSDRTRSTIPNPPLPNVLMLTSDIICSRSHSRYCFAHLSRTQVVPSMNVICWIFDTG